MIATQDIVIDDLVFELFISKEQIDNTIQRMAKEIDEDLGDEEAVFIGVLNGAFIFVSDLMRAMENDVEVHFVKLHSYDGFESSEAITKAIGLTKSIEGKKVFVIEDIVDTGFTLHHFMNDLRKQNPSSLYIVSFLVKPDMVKYPLDIKFKGIDIPPEFVVGYGLDYNGKGRSLAHIYKLKE
jgi:hypoxanthine phosphoribosyltransferase